MLFEWYYYLMIVLAGIAGGMVNALAGGGTLITFPILTLAFGNSPAVAAMVLGQTSVAANVTNTVALVPGYLGATFAQSKDLKGQKRRAWLLLPAAVVGGLIGGILLLNTGEKLFRALIPFLILAACVLLALSDPLRAWLLRRAGQHSPQAMEVWAVLPIVLAAVYGGYFGAGLSVIVLAVLGLMLDDSLTRLNALKQFIAFSANVAAAVFFVFSGKVVWHAAVVMAVGALIGGALGGRLASRIKPGTLRLVVVGIGMIIAIIYFINIYLK
jgi:hypothetical protein